MIPRNITFQMMMNIVTKQTEELSENKYESEIKQRKAEGEKMEH